MKFKKLSLRNYRTFENLDLEFPDFYTAVCGQNDAGKSNFIRALQVLLGPDDPFYRRLGFHDLTHSTDYPKWLVGAQQPIQISCELVIHKEYDAGLYSFINKWLELQSTETEIVLTSSAIAKDKVASTEFERLRR